jgi:aldose 1-epimerase
MKQQHYGTKDGREVDIYSLASGSGLRVILALGRIRAALEAPDRQGRSANVVLGPGSLSDYAYVSPHFGAMAERYAIRIVHGCFTFDGVEYRLETNAGPTPRAPTNCLLSVFSAPTVRALPAISR